MILFASSLKEKEVREHTGRPPDWLSERPGRSADDTEDVKSDVNGSVAEIRAWLDENAAKGNPRVFSRTNFLGEMDLETEPSFQHYFALDIDSMGAEPVLVTRNYAEYSGAAWISEERIVVAGTARTDVHPDYVRDTDLFTVRPDGSEFRRFLDLPGLELGTPLVSPDRQSIAFLASDSEDAGYAQTELGVVSLSDTTQARLVTVDFDRSVSNPKWSEDGWYLYFSSDSDGGVPLYRLRPFGSPEADTTARDSTLVAGELEAAPGVERLTSLQRGIQSYDVGRATVFFVATEVANPYELYASNLPFTQESRVTSHNAGWLAEKRLSFPDGHTLVHDGREIQYWIMKPAFFDSSRSYPLLLAIHGGPSAMWGPGEDSMWHEFQFFASRGYAIVFSNPRGSGGYGYDFKRANYRDWGDGPAGDVLAVASEAASLPWIDSTRQVVTGGSYAGYLTAWIVGHDDRFKAA
ncbi:MAG: prolyl oligopeptidase family serine peptidase, partial [Rhodothermales bacterium]